MSEEGMNIFTEALRRQFECSACDKRIRGVQPAYDERNQSLEEGARRTWAPGVVRLDTICCKQLRRRTVTWFLTWRPSSETDAATFRRGWDDGASRLVTPPTTRRAPSFPTPPVPQRIGIAFWSREETRLLCPPVELMKAVVRKLRISKAPALLLMPNWPRQAWYQPPMDMITKVHRRPLPPEEVWAGTRRLDPSWSLLLIEVNLPADVHPFLPTQL
jgi:hypothetical protein